VKYAIFCSYGNDSIALMQWLYEKGERDAYTVFSDTGWASKTWADRLDEGEDFARRCGYTPIRIHSMGMVPLVRLRKGWPRQGMQFCTEELKIKPAQKWLNEVDPDGELVCCVGIRRQESRARSSWPEWVEESERHGGRSLYSPLVRVTTEERDALVKRAGFDVLPHRSMECFPCVNSNRRDLRELAKDPERVRELAELEESLGKTGKGKPRTIFRPYRHMGAVGIEEVVRWAVSEPGKYGESEQLVLLGPGSGCDSGMCGES